MYTRMHYSGKSEM